MGRVYGDPVEVHTRQDGRPVRFAWRGRHYAVGAVQEHWLVNRAWWRESAPVPVHPELEFWRVEASHGQDQHGQDQHGQDQDDQDQHGQDQPTGVYELRRDIAAGTWTLRRIAD